MNVLYDDAYLAKMNKQDNYATIEPYPKFMLACSKTESMYGHQMKQGDGYGVSSTELNYVPPMYYGFVLVCHFCMERERKAYLFM